MKPRRIYRVVAGVIVGGWLAVGTTQAGLFQSGSERAAREKQREEQQRVGDIFKAMGAAPGAVVADVGAGAGFFTVRLSKLVGPTGRVLAVDVNRSTLRSLETRVQEEGLTNVDLIEGEPDDPRLPPQILDAALIVNAYHEMTEHQAMLGAIRKALKPGGRLVIVEPISPSRRDAPRDAQTRQHEIAPDLVKRDAREAGFVVTAFEDPFSNHHGHGSEYMLVLTPDATWGSLNQGARPGARADSAAAGLRAWTHSWRMGK